MSSHFKHLHTQWKSKHTHKILQLCFIVIYDLISISALWTSIFYIETREGERENQLKSMLWSKNCGETIAKILEKVLYYYYFCKQKERDTHLFSNYVTLRKSKKKLSGGEKCTANWFTLVYFSIQHTKQTMKKQQKSNTLFILDTFSLVFSGATNGKMVFGLDSHWFLFCYFHPTDVYGGCEIQSYKV